MWHNLRLNFWFNGNKIITTSSGGMLITRNEQQREKALFWATQSREDALWYQHEEIGYNYRMSNIVAGIGRGQMKHLDEHRALKEKIYHRYEEGFKGLPVMVLQTPDVEKYFSKRVSSSVRRVVIPNPVKEKLPSYIGSSEKKEFISACRLVEQKNLPNLIDAFEKVVRSDSGCTLKIYGKGPLRQQLFDYISGKGLSSREWQYKNVRPRIIAEQYMTDEKNEFLPVYKIFCFDGEPKIIQLIQNDKQVNESIDYFDTQWHILDLRQNFPNSKMPLPKPKHLDLMLNLATKLSKDKKSFLRVDLYEIGSKLYFSKFTFFSDTGMAKFYPGKWDYILGEWTTIPDDPA